MPDGFDIAQRGMRGGFPRGGFPMRRFPHRFPMRRFPHRFPMRFRRFPRFFFFPTFFPSDGCFFIDRFGRCCDRFGRCGFFDGSGFDGSGFDDFGFDGSPFASSDESIESWSASDSWDRMDDGRMDDDHYDQY